MIIFAISPKFWLFHFLFGTTKSFGAGSIVGFFILGLLGLAQINSRCLRGIRLMDDLN